MKNAKVKIKNSSQIPRIAMLQALSYMIQSGQHLQADSCVTLGTHTATDFNTINH